MFSCTTKIMYDGGKPPVEACVQFYLVLVYGNSVLCWNPPREGLLFFVSCTAVLYVLKIYMIRVDIVVAF